MLTGVTDMSGSLGVLSTSDVVDCYPGYDITRDDCNFIARF